MEDNNALRRKYKENERFQYKMAKVQEKYKILQQQALYANHKMIDPRSLFGLSAPTEKDTHLYLIFGCLQPPATTLDAFLLYFITKISRPQRPYSIAYINTLAPSFLYAQFSTILQTMPIEYFVELRNIFVLDASFSDKAASLFSFGTIVSFLHSKTVYFNDFHPFCQALHLTEQAFFSLLPDQLITHFQQLRLRRKKSLEKNIQKKEEEEKEVPKMLISSKSQNHVSVKRGWNKKDISEYVLVNQNSKLANWEFHQQQNCFCLPFNKLRGIMTMKDCLESAQVSTQRLKQSLFLKIKTTITQNKFLILTSWPVQSIIVIDLLKKLLSSFSTPLIPFKDYQELMREANQGQFSATVKRVIKALPEIRYVTLACVMEFLVNRILPSADHNKMNANNLAICIGPSFMWAQEQSIRDFIDIQKIIVVTHILIDQFHQIFGTQKQLNLMFRRSFKIQKQKSKKQQQYTQTQKFEDIQNKKQQTQQEHKQD